MTPVMSAAGVLTVANVIRAASQWFLLALVLWLDSPAQGAAVAYALALTAPVFVFFEFGLRAVYLTRREGLEFRTYLAARVGCVAVGLALVFALSGAQRYAAAGIVLLVGLSKVFDSVADICFGVLQRVQRPVLILVFMAVRGVAACGAGGVAYLLTSSVYALLGVSAAVSVVVGIACVQVARHCDRSTPPDLRHGPAGRRPVLRGVRQVIWSGLPLGVAMLLATLVVTMPQYLLAAHATPLELALFAALLYVLTASELVLNGLSQAMLPTLSSVERRRGSGAMKRIAGRTMVVFLLGYLALAAVGLAAGPAVLPAVYGSAYAVDRAFLVPVLVAVAIGPVTFLSAAVVNVLNAYWVSLAANAAAAVAVLAFGLALVPAYGLVGAGWSLAAGAVTRALAYGCAAIAKSGVRHSSSSAADRRPRAEPVLAHSHAGGSASPATQDL